MISLHLMGMGQRLIRVLGEDGYISTLGCSNWAAGLRSLAGLEDLISLGLS